MKRLLFKISLYTLTVLGLCSSCNNYDDYHQDYIKNGEIIYAPKVDSVSCRSGKERVQVDFWLNKSPNVTKVHIYWNSGKDSLVVNVSPSNNRDSIGVILPIKVEQAYTFDLITYDKYGNKSLKNSGYASVYGANYEAGLIQRAISSNEIKKGIGYINWYGSDETLQFVEVEYTTNSNEVVVVKTLNTQNQTICPSIKYPYQYRVRSVYKPNAASIDNFATQWSDYKQIPPPIPTRVDRGEWTVIDCSSFAYWQYGEPWYSQYNPKNVIDGDLGTFWHNDWNDSSKVPPHHIVIDMKDVYQVNGFELHKRSGNNDTKTVELYISGDKVNWEKIASTIYESGDTQMKSINIGEPKFGRYLKMLQPDSRNPNGANSFAEIYVIGLLN